MSSDPGEFDKRLRHVTPPAHLAERLRAIPDWPDADLDAELASVTLPAGLLGRLHDIVDDSRLDEALCSVPVSPATLARARIVDDRRSQAEWLRKPAAQWAIAVSLILVVWSGYVSAMVAFAGSSIPTSSPRQVVWIDHGLLQLDAQQLEARGDLTESVWVSPQLAWSAEYEVPEPLEPAVPLEFVSVETELDPLEEVESLYARRNSGLSNARFTSEWNWLREQSPLEQERAAWELATVASVSTQSALWQPAAGQPHLFMVDNSPVFAPANDRRLETSRPLLSQRTSTLDWAVAMASAGRFPTGESLQLADFLAAMNYDSLGVSPGKVEWEVNAALSAGGIMYNQIRPLVLHIGVQAGGLDRSNAAASDLQIAVDVSNSMAAGRLEAVRLALTRLCPQLGNHDRVSLMAVADRVQPASAWLDCHDQFQWQQELDSLSANGSADVGLGLSAALENALERAREAGSGEQRIVLVSDTDWQATPAEQTALHRLARAAQAHGIQLNVVHLGPVGFARRVLTEVAEATGGKCMVAAESFEVYRALLKVLEQRNATVSRNLDITVRFDPKQVAAYRLLGDHAPSIVASEKNTAVSLAAGESAIAVYEVWLRPDAVATALTVDARWKNVLENKVESRRQSLSVAQLAAATVQKPMSQPPASLWLASLALAAADALKNKESEADTREAIERTLAAAQSGPPNLAGRADVSRIVRLLESSREALEPTQRGRGQRRRDEPDQYNRTPE